MTKEDKEKTAGRHRVSSEFDTQRAEVAVFPQDSWEAYCKSIGDNNTDDDVEDDEEDNALPSPTVILNREFFLK